MLDKKIIAVFIAFSIIIFTGVSGYISIEGWSLLDALYMTIITIASVGFMEVHPLSSAGRLFTIVLILYGSGVLIYGISVITAFIVEGELTDALRRRKMNKLISGLKGHFIVCGADQTGRYVIEELVRTKKDFIVIEKDSEKIKQLTSQNILCIEGDATHDAVLLRAGIEKARGFATSLPTDAENLFAVITAKRLNPSLRVIAKGVEEESEQKIRMVGADGVVLPSFIGGLRIASEMIRPSVVNFLDVMLRAEDRTIRVEEIELEDGSPFAGKTIEETGLRDTEGVSIVALKDRSSNSYLFNPSRETRLKEHAVLIAIGNVETINSLREKAAPPETSH